MTHIRLNLLVAAAVLGLVAGCNRDPASDPAVKDTAPASQDTAAAPSAVESTKVTVAGVGSCEPSPELETIVSRITQTADADGNGQIEKEEAYSAADFLVGGFFFRADKNFDGTLSPEEGRATRTELMNRHPVLAAVMQRVATAENSAALARMTELLGIDYDKGVSSNEMRDAGHRLIDDVYRLGDADKNGSLTASEVQQAASSRMRALASSAFDAHDTDRDKKLTLAEFQSALREPSGLAFRAADANNDGSLTEAEAASAVRSLARRVWLPGGQAARDKDVKRAL